MKMDPFRKWMTRAIVVLVVLNATSLYSNWRLVKHLRSPTPTVEIQNAADAALQAK